MILSILFTTFTLSAAAQVITQTVKGKVTDAETGVPLQGATIIGGASYGGGVSDSAGNFELTGIPVGRQMFTISYVGYETVSAYELVSSGKEGFLDIRLSPASQETGGVIVRSRYRKGQSQNPMGLVSARSFSVEETRRYAGGLDDPARLVSAFAGVSTGNVSDNAIIIRGNAPKGVSWRLEGVEIPTPHHFEGGNYAGGGIVTLFSSQLLANSDFFTGAFPAEYNNAIAGVFDMKFRNGNAEKHEHAFQLGMLGIDLASEGPISRKSGSSYLMNYRYSTLGLLTDLKLIDSDQAFKYQDLSFKLHFPAKNAGSFTLWGIGGIDDAGAMPELDSLKWETDRDRMSFDWKTRKGAIGLTHKKALDSRSTWQTTFSASGQDNRMDMDQYVDQYAAVPDLRLSDKTYSMILQSAFTHRFNPHAVVKTGFEIRHLGFDLDVNSAIDYRPGTFRNFVDGNGSTRQYMGYVQSKMNLTPAIVLTGGLQFNHFAFTRSSSLEPRIGITSKLHARHSVSLGYGLHSQPEQLKFYLSKHESGGTVSYPNRNLRPTSAHHLVLAYHWSINEKTRLTIEPYYQLLHNAPGSIEGTYSMLNYKQDYFFPHQMANNGQGINKGIDFTLERFLADNYYYLVTGSVFDSKYQTHDNTWRNTRYNKRYVLNLLGGKEFFFRENRRVLGINGRLNVTGGERYSPILTNASILRQQVVFDESKAFEEQLPASFYADISVTYRVNRKNHSGIFALQLKNILGAPTYEGFDFNYSTGEVQRTMSSAIIPAISYKIEF